MQINCLPIDGVDIKKGFNCSIPDYPPSPEIYNGFTAGEVVIATFLLLIFLIILVYVFIRLLYKDRVEVLNRIK